MKIGVCLTLNPDDLSWLQDFKNYKTDFIETGLYNLVNKSDEDIKKIVSQTRDFGLPLSALNAFFGPMRIFDTPELRKDAREYVKKAFDKISYSDVKHITLGSGKSRSSTDVLSKSDIKKYMAELLFDTVSPLAKDYGYIIGIEPLNSAETDVFTTAKETFDFVKELNLENIKMIIDYFHFSTEKENIKDISNYKGYISHLHIASVNSKRTAPHPKDNENAEYSKFINTAKEYTDATVTMAVEGSIVSPFNETVDYLKLLCK